VVGVLCVVALVAIVAGMAGFELPLPRFGASAASAPAALPGVRALASTPLVRVGEGAPAGSDLAFLAVEPSGNLLVTDRGRKTVMRFDTAGHLLNQWGPQLGDLTIGEPAGIAEEGNSIYVIDRGAQRLIQLDTTGRVQTAFSLEELGPYGLNGLSIDPYGLLYAADTGRNRVLVMTPDGTQLKQFGRSGSDLGAFTQPMAMTFLPDGSLVVADWENSRLERWDSKYTATDEWSIGFRPFGVAADALGRLYAPDTDRRRIVAFSPKGDELGELGGPGDVQIGVAPRQLAVAPGQPTTLYALGGDGIARLDLTDTAAPVRTANDVDVIGPLVFGLLVALPLVALLLRRRRSRSVGPTADREIGLDTEDGTQGEDQQSRADEPLLVAHQAERKQ
jgi:DNA-binding beta-propeller fold protein YncE